MAHGSHKEAVVPEGSRQEDSTHARNSAQGAGGGRKAQRAPSEATQRPAMVGSCYRPGSGGTGGKRGDATRAQMGAGSTQKMQLLPGTRLKPAKGEKKCQLLPSSCVPVSYVCLHLPDLSRSPQNRKPSTQVSPCGTQQSRAGLCRPVVRGPAKSRAVEGGAKEGWETLTEEQWETQIFEPSVTISSPHAS